MSNTLLTNDIIPRAILTSFVNNLTFTKSCNQQYAKEFTEGRSATMRIQKPTRFVGRTGVTLDPEALTETKADLVLANQYGVDIELTSEELTLDIRDLTKSYFDPLTRKLANMIESSIITAALDGIYFASGTAGTAVNSFTAFNSAAAELTRVGVEAQYASLNVDDAVSLQGALQNTFNKPLNESISQRGMIGNLAGVDVLKSPFAMQHTVGAYVGTPAIAGASQTGASLTTDGWTGSVTGLLKKNDLFTIAGVYSVNPVTQESTGRLQTFRVTADVDSTTGDATIPISPSIVITTAYKTVSNSPADGALLTIVSGDASTTYKNNFVYHPDAFCLGWAQLKPSMGAVYTKTMTDKDSPVSIRLTIGYDITNDKTIYRTDVLTGVLVNPEYGVRLLGQEAQ